VTEAKARYCLCHPCRFAEVGRERRFLGHGAERTAAGAGRAQDEKGRLLSVEALGDVGAAGLPADGVEPQVTDETVHLGVGSRPNLFLQPLGFSYDAHYSPPDSCIASSDIARENQQNSIWTKGGVSGRATSPQIVNNAVSENSLLPETPCAFHISSTATLHNQMHIDLILYIFFLHTVRFTVYTIKKLCYIIL
jgi:hypothetical protein